MKKLLYLALLSSFISACFSEASPFDRDDPMNHLDRSDDLFGPDEDGDGIRDDIADYIDYHFKKEDQRKAARQAAKAMQKVFVVDVEDQIAVKAVNRELVHADNCIYRVFDGDPDHNKYQVVSKLEAIATNTKPRLKRYMEYNSALSGTTWRLPKGDTCE